MICPDLHTMQVENPQRVDPVSQTSLTLWKKSA